MRRTLVLTSLILLMFAAVRAPREAESATIYSGGLHVVGSGSSAFLIVRGGFRWDPGDSTRGQWDVIYEFYGVDGGRRNLVYRHAQLLFPGGSSAQGYVLSVDNRDRKFNEDRDRLLRKRKDEIICRVRIRYLPPGAHGAITTTEYWTNQIQGTF